MNSKNEIDKITLVVIGETGVGKSTVLNYLINKSNYFKSGSSCSSITK